MFFACQHYNSKNNHRQEARRVASTQEASRPQLNEQFLKSNKLKSKASTLAKSMLFEFSGKTNSKVSCQRLFLMVSYLLFVNNSCLLVQSEISNANSLDSLQTSQGEYSQVNASDTHTHQRQYAVHSNSLDETLKLIKRREEIERIKSETLIDVFKTKILKLLNVDQVPSPTEINIAHNTIPEPILKEYTRLIRVSRMERNKKYNLRNRFNAEARGSRDLESGEESDLEQDEFFDETVRFNGSVVQQIMLLPKKRKFTFITHSHLALAKHSNECRVVQSKTLICLHRFL